MRRVPHTLTYARRVVKMGNVIRPPSPPKAAKGREPMKKLLLRPSLVYLVALLLSGSGLAAVPTIDGASAAVEALYRLGAEAAR